MTIFNIITLMGGVALFLFGMSFLGTGLEKMSGGRLETVLERMTGNVFKGVLLGAGVTAVIQSSSATTVMVVGFVNAGIMKLAQTVGIIFGANIGTTVTSQILSLGDIDSSQVAWLALFKPTTWGPIICVIGVVLYMFTKRDRKRSIGQILLGLGVLFAGMNIMEMAVTPLGSDPGFAKLFTMFSNPLLGLLAGMLVTAIIQSSSASVGILQALSATGAIPFSAAAPIILGQNIGTCITALLASVGASRNAKRAAMIHLYFNVIGSLVFLGALYAINGLFHLSFWDDIVNRSMIANFHLVFNSACVLFLLPFNKLLVRLAEKTIPDKGDKLVEISVLDDRFLQTPALALEKAREMTVQLARYSLDNYRRSVALLENYEERKQDQLNEVENVMDRMEARLDNYLVQLTKRTLMSDESFSISELLRAIGDFERIGDYAINLSEAAENIFRKELSFSDHAKAELKIITDAVGEILANTVVCFEGGNYEKAMEIEPLEQVIDRMQELLRDKHIERLKNGSCSVESGAQFLELLINLERISDHCSNVAVYVIQRREFSKRVPASLDPHEFLRELHEGSSDTYIASYQHYKAKYYEALR